MSGNMTVTSSKDIEGVIKDVQDILVDITASVSMIGNKQLEVQD